MSITNNGSSVVLDNVDDYIAPSQACVNPLFQGDANTEEKKEKEKETKPAPATVAVVKPNRRRKVVRRVINNEANDEDKPEALIQPAIPKKKDSKEDSIKASIADCLACSGCVTTAETVLLEQRHSLSSLRQRLQLSTTGKKRRAITISPNSWADLCRHWNFDDNNNDCYAKFTTLLHQILHATWVIDGNLPLLWTWLDEANEFVQVYKMKTKQQQQQVKMTPPPDPSFAVNSKKTTYYRRNGTTEVVLNCDDPNAQISSSSKSLPLISGSCPALVCLVEKSWNSLVPYLSQAQSPMSRMGNCLNSNDNNNDTDNDGNNNNNNDDNKNSHDWDHWAIMPCHDKKLEASRQDFVLFEENNKDDDNKTIRAVDLVITTQELVELVEEWMTTFENNNNSEESSSTTTKTKMTMAERLNALQPATRRSVSSPNDFIRYCTSTEDQQQTSLITISDNDNLSFENSNNNNKEDSGSGISSDENKHKQMAYSSGGHADFIFRYAAKELFDYNLSFIDWKPASAALAIGNGNKKLRSARLAKKYAQQQHYYEAKLYRTADGTYSQEEQQQLKEERDTSSPSEVVLHFVIAHGMQTLQRALKDLDDARSSSSLPSSSSSSSSIVQYVEAMACPFGCVNGGGIVRSTSSSSSSSSSAVTTRETPTDTRQRVQKTVAQLTVPSPEGAHQQQPQASTNDQQKQQQQLQATTTTIQQLHTRYHVVPPMQHTMGAAAGVKVQDMVW